MKTKLSRRTAARIENVGIVLLTCCALFLMGKTGIFEGFQGLVNANQNVAALSDDQNTLLTQQIPARLVIQTQTGRYGVQYDQTSVDNLYNGGLNILLAGSLSSLTGLKEISQGQWQQAITGGEEWIYYDFQYNVPFSTADSRTGQSGRCFLLSAKAGTVNTLCYYDAQTGRCYSGAAGWTEDTAVRNQLTALPDNGARFAFEEPEQYQTLAPQVMVLPEELSCPVYAVNNPLSGMDQSTQDQLLQDLEINTRADSVYESADGLVVREGADTLRILKDGTVTFHSTDSGQSRYPTASASGKTQQEEAEAILKTVATTQRCGEGRLICRSSETGEDGSTEILFSYLLNGAQVQLYEDGYGAKFVFQGSDLVSFEIRFRQYVRQEAVTPLLPQRQAAAAMATLGQTGKELLLCYQDTGGDTASAGWMSPEQG